MMTRERELLQQALDAITDDVDGTGLNTMPSFDKAIDAIAALREALAPDHLRDVAEKVAPAAPVPDALAEAVAKAIYWEWRRDAGYVPWVDGGNSLKQDDARKIARAVVSSAAPVVPLTDERITKALRRAFSLGQTYWQQADSDSYKQNAKSDETRQKFETLIVETLNGITGGKP